LTQRVSRFLFIGLTFLFAHIGPLAHAQSSAAPTPFEMLKPQDRALYREAFAAAAAGDAATSNEKLKATTDSLLRPYLVREQILATRGPDALPSAAAWLSVWPDVAGAEAVYNHATALQQLAVTTPTDGAAPVPALTLRRPTPVPVRRSMGAMREPNFEPVPIGAGATRADRARIDVLASRFYAGDDDTALALASQEIEGPQSGQAGWIGGLAAFRLGDYANAARYFRAAANWGAGDDWSRSAGAFWAARAVEKLGEAEAAQSLLEQAASNPLTFYGQLALAKLGRWDTLVVPSIADEQERAARLIGSDIGVRRAIALTEIGRTSDAEAELLAAWSRGHVQDELGYLSIARALGLQNVMARISQSSAAATLAHLYPAPLNIRPNGGAFVLDRAVVLAVIRQESKFQPEAVSYSGARGLMQLMPRTAAWMTGRRDFASNPSLLTDVSLNVTLGEAYLEKMMAEGPISNCLIRTFMAYNAGPGSVSRWAISVKGGEDPLMFMEGAPKGQARIYAEKVMSNLWIYHRRFGQRAPSLEKLARGFTPTYEPQDNPRLADASAQRPATALQLTAFK
jgi:soluble lytic murein transglycosylase-like protein